MSDMHKLLFHANLAKQQLLDYFKGVASADEFSAFTLSEDEWLVTDEFVEWGPRDENGTENGFTYDARFYYGASGKDWTLFLVESSISGNSDGIILRNDKEIKK